jgi:hypothetical protein
MTVITETEIAAIRERAEGRCCAHPMLPAHHDDCEAAGALVYPRHDHVWQGADEFCQVCRRSAREIVNWPDVCLEDITEDTAPFDE